MRGRSILENPVFILFVMITIGWYLGFFKSFGLGGPATATISDNTTETNTTTTQPVITSQSVNDKPAYTTDTVFWQVFFYAVMVIAIVVLLVWHMRYEKLKKLSQKPIRAKRINIKADNY